MPSKRAGRPIPEAPVGLSEPSAAAWPGLAADVIAASGGAELDFALLADVLRARDRLAEVGEILARDGLTTTGSKEQIRPHPLLESESALRREVSLGFERLRLAPNRRDWRVDVGPDGRLKS
jgi:hypothetical protein